MQQHKIYLAYGSNLHMGQMAHRCPTATPVGKLILPDQQLVFRGSRTGSYATIEPCIGKKVPVLVWSVQHGDVESLDRYEGYPSFYTRKSVKLHMDSLDKFGFVYIMTPGRMAGMPSRQYLETIREGYRNCGFDQSFLDEALVYTAQQMDLEKQEFEPFYEEAFTQSY